MPGLSTDEIGRASRGKARALSCPLAVQTYRTGAKALPCQRRAEDGYGWFAPKPCERIGRERRLCRVKAVRMMAMARFAPKPCGRIGRERRLCRVKAVWTSGQARRPRLRWALS